MKSNFVFAAALSLFVFAFAVSAQEKVTDFGGIWNLDVSKSKLGDRNNIESQTVTVTQTATEIKIETATKRTPPPAGAPAGGGRMGGGGGDMPATYTLDGKETKTSMETQMGSIPVTMKAKWDGAKLNLSRSSTFNGPMGEVTSTTKETWELGADGKTLTVNTERTSPRGTDTSTKVFAKKP